ncbi:hypothetical protein TSUD_363850 [Trifolium subterraneum]|uniref:F-box domain-containing protein n=1 Tax=Trifolium subterraneum TaxID=3900 RepID=A0A2Z6N521_TRISU|nr:hypothetical protein TSUD_363850 [Trifolium subterraneum]
MAKSLTIAKVSNHIPEDLAFSILSKLPLKSLKRFGCVSKTWSLLFQIPNFMSKFRNNFISIPHSYYNDTSILLHQIVYNDAKTQVYFSLHSLFGERFENRLKLDFPNPFQQEDPGFNILRSGSITGILCLFQHNEVVLWNPTTDEFKVIPPSSAESVPPHWDATTLFYGFGYDHESWTKLFVIGPLPYIEYPIGEISSASLFSNDRLTGEYNAYSPDSQLALVFGMCLGTGCTTLA